MPNRRFGTTNKFGTSNKFGASSGLTGVSVGFEVDWDGDGLFDGTNEAPNRMVHWEERRGREFFFDSGGQGFQPVSRGELRVTLLNIDRRYDPFYLAGSLYAFLNGNQKARLRVVDNANVTAYYDFTGYIDNIRPIYGAVDKVEFTIYDGIKKLDDKKISSPYVYATVQYDDQIAEGLGLAGWTDGQNIDDTVSDTMSYHWFRGNSTFDEIQTLADAAFGTFFISADGKASYKSRISSDTADIALSEADIDYDYGIQSPSPREVIKNVIKIYARARKLQTAVEIWRMTDTPQVATGTGSPIWANYNYNGEEVPALSVTEPVATTDYTANANADGSGADRTGNFSFARTGFATSSKLVPSNSGAAAYITLLKLRGNVITADNYTFAQDSDAASILSYGERELVINSDWLQDVNTAVEQVDLLLSRFTSPRQYPRVKIKRSRIDLQYSIDLFDLVTINFDSRDISAEMRAGYIERSWDISEPNVIDTIIHFEPNLTVSSSGAWIFPITFPAEFA